MNYFYYFVAGFFLTLGILMLVDAYKRRRYKPQVGDRLCRRNAIDNPFDKIILEVVAVKDGWVQYSFHPVRKDSSTYSDTVSNIREYYTKIN